MTYRVCTKRLGRSDLPSAIHESLPMPIPLPHASLSHASPHRSLSSLMPPAPRRRSLVWGGSPLLQTAIIERLGQSNLRQNRKDEMLHQRMRREWHEGYLDAIEDET